MEVSRWLRIISIFGARSLTFLADHANTGCDAAAATAAATKCRSIDAPNKNAFIPCDAPYGLPTGVNRTRFAFLKTSDGASVD